MQSIQKYLKRYTPYHFALFFILLLGISLRFMNTPDLYVIDGDGIRDAIVAYEGAKAFSFPLSGPFSSTGPYTFGPLYYISLIVFSILLPIPYSPWILMGIVSVLTILFMADIGRLLYSKTFGLILAVITAIAPTQIDAATSLSNINPVTFFATLSLWITFKIIKKEAKNYLWYFFLGLVIGMGVNTHYQMFGLFVLPLLLWVFMGWKNYFIPLFISLGVFVTFIPLLIFNQFTDWHTLRGLREMYIAKDRTYVPNSWSIYLFQFWISHLKFLFLSPLIITVAFIATCIFVFLRDVIKKKYSPGLIMLVIIFFVNFVWLRYYWGERHDVYIYYLSPLLFIFLGYALFSLLQMKYGKILFIIFFSFLCWNMLSFDILRIRTASNSESVAWKKEAQMLRAKYPTKNISLYSCDNFYGAHKRYLIYLLRFHYKPHAEEKKIAMKGVGCFYPDTGGFTFRDNEIKEKFAEGIYPQLFPELKDTNFNFIDISQASPLAIKEAEWYEITTTDVFNSSVNWWR